MLQDLNNIENLFEELEILRKRSKLLDDILQKYDPDTLTFEISEKWKTNRVRSDMLPAANPREFMLKKIREVLSYVEQIEFGIAHIEIE